MTYFTLSSTCTIFSFYSFVKGLLCNLIYFISKCEPGNNSACFPNLNISAPLQNSAVPSLATWQADSGQKQQLTHVCPLYTTWKNVDYMVPSDHKKIRGWYQLQFSLQNVSLPLHIYELRTKMATKYILQIMVSSQHIKWFGSVSQH